MVWGGVGRNRRRSETLAWVELDPPRAALEWSSIIFDLHFQVAQLVSLSDIEFEVQMSGRRGCRADLASCLDHCILCCF